MTHHRQSGVALLQSLLLITILSLLALQVSYEVRGQIELVEDIESKLRADLRASSLQREVVFKLLTVDDRAQRFGNQWDNAFESNGLTQTLNFGGRKIVVHVENLAGYLPLNFPDNPVWLEALTHLGMDADSAQRFLNKLTDYQDHDRVSQALGNEPLRSESGFLLPNRLLHFYSELDALAPVVPDRLQRVVDISHPYPINEVNARLVAQNLLRQTFVTPDEADAIKNSVWSDERVVNFPSPYWRVTVIDSSGRLAREYVGDYVLQSLSPVPFLFLGEQH